MNFDPYWLEPAAVIPVDIKTTAALVTEIHRLRQALAQPSEANYKPRYNPTINAFDTAPPCQTGAQCIGGKCPECEWVGLTDEEISECWNRKITPVHGFAREVEKMLKEKNT